MMNLSTEMPVPRIKNVGFGVIPKLIFCISGRLLTSSGIIFRHCGARPRKRGDERRRRVEYSRGRRATRAEAAQVKDVHARAGRDQQVVRRRGSAVAAVEAHKGRGAAGWHRHPRHRPCGRARRAVGRRRVAAEARVPEGNGRAGGGGKQPKPCAVARGAPPSACSAAGGQA